jgi:hypothetical protein
MAFTIASLLPGVGQGHGNGSGDADLPHDALQCGPVVISVRLLLWLPVTVLRPVVAAIPHRNVRLHELTFPQLAFVLNNKLGRSFRQR